MAEVVGVAQLVALAAGRVVMVEGAKMSGGGGGGRDRKGVKERLLLAVQQLRFPRDQASS